MRKSFFLTMALCVLGFGASLLTSCDEYELYKIDSPDDLKDKVDSIAAANNPQRGDTLKLDIITAIVGAEDNTAGWWSSFSDYFTIPSNRLLHLEFVNYGSGANNWNNWNLCLCTGERDGDGYSEYFVLRSDMYGWGNGDYNGAMIKSDYGENLLGDDMWATFREKMQGAKVYMDIDHSKTGNAYVTVKHVATDGTEFTESYEQPVSSTADINAFLICDGSHFVMKDAYTITSKVQAVEDQEAVELIISGMPEAVEVGAEDVWGSAQATVIFADGSSAVVEKDDLSFTMPDLTTVGTKTILVSYSKTKQGNYGPSVAAYYTVEVTNSVVAISVSHAPFVTKYYTFDGVIAPLFTAGLEITAEYADGTTGIMPLDNLQFGLPAPEVGQQSVPVIYQGSSTMAMTEIEIEVEAGTGLVGLPDCTTAWWTAFSDDKVVPAGQSVEFKMTVLSNPINNWHSPCTILRGAALNEYAVVRQDNFGWGDGYATATLESNWNWDNFLSGLNGEEVTITVKNNGDNTADIIYNVIYPNGEEHFQNYLGITVNSDDLQTALVTEGSCLILHE